jgi:hypothetical protein
MPPARGAVWYADVPNKRCVRVREGGDVLQTVNVDRGCFACMLGGPHRRTLFIVATEWRGMEKAAEVARANWSIADHRGPRARRRVAIGFAKSLRKPLFGPTTVAISIVHDDSVGKKNKRI